MASTTQDEEAKLQELLPLLRQELSAELKNNHVITDDQLLPFLRWKADTARAAGRFRAFCAWKKANPGLFDETLRVSHDPELRRLLASQVLVAPPGLVAKVDVKNSKTDNDATDDTTTTSPVLIGRLRNNDMKDGRTVHGVCRGLFYTLDRLLEQPAASSVGVTILHDLRGFNPSRNADLGIPRTLFGAIFGHFPVRVSKIYLLQAPLMFHAFFQVVSLLFPSKVRARCHFIKSLDEIQDVIDIHQLPQDVGGKQPDEAFDITAWMDEQAQREQEGTLGTMTTIGATVDSDTATTEKEQKE